jgi:hypothetical protein
MADDSRNRLIHIASLALTKTADGLIDPKLVLAWLLNALGSPAFLIGLLVPVREAGALLPQLLLARGIQESRRRKVFWIAGSAIQGLCAVAIAAAAFGFSGAVAGWLTLTALAILACARSACSASYKDVLARTVEKGSRGKISGSAGSISAIAVFAFALLLGWRILPLSVEVVAGAIAVAGALWLIGAMIFGFLEEPEDDASAATDRSFREMFEPLQSDPEFQTYIATRALLISTALAPPFLVMLGNLGEGDLGNLGILMIASSIAAVVSSYVWGALSDRSSRQTLMAAGAISAITLCAAAVAGFAGMGPSSSWLVPAFIFTGQLAYNGARQGRKTHLTDMDTQDQKPVYTALSNTVIGIMLLAGGLLGVLSDVLGPPAVLGVLASLSAAAVIVAYFLSEVQADTE